MENIQNMVSLHTKISKKATWQRWNQKNRQRRSEYRRFQFVADQFKYITFRSAFSIHRKDIEWCRVKKSSICRLRYYKGESEDNSKKKARLPHSKAGWNRKISLLQASPKRRTHTLLESKRKENNGFLYTLNFQA